MIYIITDEYPEFVKICIEKGITNKMAIFVNSPHKIYGRMIKETDEVIYGDYCKHKKEYEIEVSMRRRYADNLLKKVKAEDL